MMKKIVLFSGMIFSLFLSGCAQSGGQSSEKNENSPHSSLKTVTLKVWTIGPDRPAVHRLNNLIEAARRLNERLLQEKAGVQIQIEGEFFTSSWEDYKKKLNAAFLAGNPPDIFLTGHEDIGRLAKQKEILDLTDRISKDSSGVFSDFYPALWNAVKWKGRIYGIPQDTEVRGVFYRKDLLRKMGWSSSAVENFSHDVQSGQITLETLRNLGRKAQKSGLVEWGMFHRPSPGVDFFQYYLIFGGRMEDPEKGKLVLNRKAMQKTLSFFYDLIYTDQILPREMSTISWSVVNEKTARGQILFNLTAGSWNKAEYLLENGISDAYFNENVGFAPIPPEKKGGMPLTLSRPMVYFISSECPVPDLAFQILNLASDPELNLKHALESAHLAIRKTEAELPAYRKDPYLLKATEYLQYARFIPNHEHYLVYHSILFEVIKNMELMGTLPHEALKRLEGELKQRLGPELVVE